MKRAELAYVGAGGELLVAGPRLKPVSVATGVVGRPTWAPDGSALAYVGAAQGGDRAVYVAELPAAGSRPLTPARSDLAGVSWSPRGDLIAADAGTAGGGRTLLVIDARTGRAVASLEYAWGYAWSPSGDDVAIGAPRVVEPPLPVEDGRTSDVVAVRVADGARRTLLEGSSTELYFPIEWRDDGTLLARETPADPGRGSPVVEVRPGETPPAVEPAGLPAGLDSDSVGALLPGWYRDRFTGEFSWAPDGARVAFVAEVPGEGPRVYVLERGSGRVRSLGPGRSPAWRPQVPGWK